jgi:DNA-binding HxlR family transcriptional regulator
MSSQLKPSSSNACNRLILSESCEVNELLLNISSRWKMQILHSIAAGRSQFSLLKKAFPSLSDQVLGKRLSELTDDKLVVKSVLAGKSPIQIVYTPTLKGNDLLKIIDDLHKWGIAWS